jgi:hypothetical protein
MVVGYPWLPGADRPDIPHSLHSTSCQSYRRHFVSKLWMCTRHDFHIPPLALPELPPHNSTYVQEFKNTFCSIRHRYLPRLGYSLSSHCYCWPSPCRFWLLAARCLFGSLHFGVNLLIRRWGAHRASVLVAIPEMVPNTSLRCMWQFWHLPLDEEYRR